MNISKILLDLPQKVPRITVEMGIVQYQRLLLYVWVVFSLPTLNSPIIAHHLNRASREILVNMSIKQVKTQSSGIKRENTKGFFKTESFNF